MKPEIKKRWLTALRGGEYKQGQGTLKNQNDEFCCLGVLCDIYGKEKNVSWIQIEFNCKHFVFLGSSGSLPVPVMEWAEIDYKKETPRVNIYSLMYLNDDKKLTFDEIANVIEEKL